MVCSRAAESNTAHQSSAGSGEICGKRGRHVIDLCGGGFYPDRKRLCLSAYRDSQGRRREMDLSGQSD